MVKSEDNYQDSPELKHSPNSKDPEDPNNIHEWETWKKEHDGHPERQEERGTEPLLRIRRGMQDKLQSLGDKFHLQHVHYNQVLL